jgi:hypothetical protein
MRTIIIVAALVSWPVFAYPAERALLYESVKDRPTGRQSTGGATWRTETPSSGELAIRADIEIPERAISLALTLRRNTDTKLPASHTIELKFKAPPETSVENAPGMLAKDAEKAQGRPLAAISIKVSKSFFLIGLSNVKKDLRSNMTRLRRKTWFDIPIVYADGTKAILTVAKGETGKAAFAEAARLWGQPFVDPDPECERLGRPDIGMTRGEAEATCWGKPERIEPAVTPAGSRERLHYKNSQYLEFEGGKLSLIKEED